MEYRYSIKVATRHDNMAANLIFERLFLHFEITLNRQELMFNYLDINFSSCCYLIRLRMEFFKIITRSFSILQFLTLFKQILIMFR